MDFCVCFAKVVLVIKLVLKVVQNKTKKTFDLERFYVLVKCMYNKKTK